VSESSLPQGWIQATLNDVARWSSGGTPRRSNPEFFGGEIPWVVIGDLQDGPVADSTIHITDRGLRASAAKWVPPGSVMLAMYGSIGKLGIASCPLTTNQAIAFAVADDSLVSNKYLFWYLRSARDELMRAGKGGTQRNISQTVIKSFPIPLAPRNEQEVIVEEIEKQLTRLDAGEKSLRGSARRLRSFQSSILAALLGGDGSWEVNSLADLGDFYDGHTPKGADTHVDPGGTTPWFKVKDMNVPGNERWMRVAPNRLAQAAVAGRGFRVMPSGTIIFPKLGGAVATNKKRILVEPSCCDLNTMGFRPRENLEGYLWLWFKQVDLATMAQGSVVPQLRKKELAGLPVLVPPASSVKDVVNEGERLLSLKDELAQEIGAARRLSARLRTSILAKAFSGGLVRPMEAKQS
jgi:restriction endonuclease S subunit